MQNAQEKTSWFFVDESGDPAFYGAGGDVIVGQPGCSRVLLLGFIETESPEVLRDALLATRTALADDGYLAGIPSLSKSLLAFHAKDDCPEVRMLVYRTLEKLNFSAQIVVARKIERMFRTRYQGSQDQFYHDLIARLFENRLHLASRNIITFSRRGNKSRQHTLRAAIDAGIERFRKKWRMEFKTEVQILTSQPRQEPVLQVIDYANWAVQRAYEKSDMRYFNFLRDKYSLICDLFDRDRYKGGKNYYDRARNPFDIKKIGPLG